MSKICELVCALCTCLPALLHPQAHTDRSTTITATRALSEMPKPGARSELRAAFKRCASRRRARQLSH